MFRTSLAASALLLAATAAANASAQPAVNPPADSAATPAAPATQATETVDTIRIATWNIENWRDHFVYENDLKGTRRTGDEAYDQLRTVERFQNEEDNWEIAQVFNDPAFDADVLVFQEGCSQENLEQFNKEWLSDAYGFVRVFRSNSERGQTVGIMVKKGFEVVEVADEFHEMPDTDDINPRGDRLFARGPGFALIESPSGYRFWVGTTHQKSKSGNSVEVTRWRNAEAAATRQIIHQLQARGSEDVILLGDMNDEIGLQEFESEGGGDVMANLVGADGEGLVLATRDLAEQGAISYTGYWRPRYRSFIDHIVITDTAANQVAAVGLFDTPWARVASDHLPVFIDIRPDAASE